MTLDTSTLVPIVGGIVLMFGLGAAARWLRADRDRRRRLDAAAIDAAKLTDDGGKDDAAALERQRANEAGINQLESVAADSIEDAAKVLPLPGLPRK